MPAVSSARYTKLRWSLGAFVWELCSGLESMKFRAVLPSGSYVVCRLSSVSSIPSIILLVIAKSQSLGEFSRICFCCFIEFSFSSWKFTFSSVDGQTRHRPNDLLETNFDFRNQLKFDAQFFETAEKTFVSKNFFTIWETCLLDEFSLPFRADSGKILVRLEVGGSTCAPQLFPFVYNFKQTLSLKLMLESMKTLKHALRPYLNCQVSLKKISIKKWRRF